MIDWRLGDIRLPYRHFERSEKSLSFAVQWSMGGNLKWETCHQETFGHRRLQKRCSGILINRLLETHFSTLFHTASALSAPSGHLPLEGKAIKLSGRTFLAPHRGNCPKGLRKRTGFLEVKRRENPVRRHFERSEMRGLRSGIA